MQYNIKDGQDASHNIDKVIEKRGHLVTFTLREINKNVEAFERNIKEMKAKIEYEGAKMKNIEEHHPFVKDVPEFERHTIHMYHEAERMKKAAERVLLMHEQDFAELNAELEEMKVQVPEVFEEDEPTELKLNHAEDETGTDAD